MIKEKSKLCNFLERTITRIKLSCPKSYTELIYYLKKKEAAKNWEKIHKKNRKSLTGFWSNFKGFFYKIKFWFVKEELEENEIDFKMF